MEANDVELQADPSKLSHEIATRFNTYYYFQIKLLILKKLKLATSLIIKMLIS